MSKISGIKNQSEVVSKCFDHTTAKCLKYLGAYYPMKRQQVLVTCSYTTFVSGQTPIWYNLRMQNSDGPKNGGWIWGLEVWWDCKCWPLTNVEGHFVSGQHLQGFHFVRFSEFWTHYSLKNLFQAGTHWILFSTDFRFSLL